MRQMDWIRFPLYGWTSTRLMPGILPHLLFVHQPSLAQSWVSKFVVGFGAGSLICGTERCVSWFFLKTLLENFGKGWWKLGLLWQVRCCNNLTNSLAEPLQGVLQDHGSLQYVMVKAPLVKHSTAARQKHCVVWESMKSLNFSPNLISKSLTQWSILAQGEHFVRLDYVRGICMWSRNNGSVYCTAVPYVLREHV